MNTQIDKNYIKKQISVYRISTNPNTKDDALWRIADHLNVKNLDRKGTLTDQQKQQVINYINRF
jgi:hypothetical protein